MLLILLSIMTFSFYLLWGGAGVNIRIGFLVLICVMRNARILILSSIGWIGEGIYWWGRGIGREGEISDVQV